MAEILEFERVTKSFGQTTALDELVLAIRPGHVVGLVGRNGSGKTTLLHLAAGLVLPTRGACRAFGRPTAELRQEELARIGLVRQESRFLPWMSVRQHLDFVGSFFPRRDRERERRLVRELDLDAFARVGALSPGNLQKLALLTAVCHRPELLLLDEPVSALDPLARETLLSFLLELIQEEGMTIVVSSHALRDVERVVDWIVCLERGRVRVDSGLDELRERYAEWRVTSANGPLPRHFEEDFVVEQKVEGREALLLVRDGEGARASFEARHRLRVEALPLNLERMFPLWMTGDRP